jgi:hypothetical protein
MSDKVGLDILNDNTAVDLTTVRTAMPVLKPATHSAVIKKVSLDENKNRTGYNLNLEYTLVNQAESDDDKILNPGFVVFDLISLVKTFKEDGSVAYNPVEKLVAIIEAVTGEKTGTMTPKEMVLLIQSFVGRSIVFRTVIDNKNPEFGTKTRIARYIKSA